MRIRCPKCGRVLKWSEKLCGCGFSLTFGGIIRYFWDSLWASAKAAATAKCPGCGERVPFSAAICQNCGASMTLDAAYEATVGPARRRWHSFLDTAPAGVKRFVQWTYLILSVAALWRVLSYLEEHFEDSWFAYVGLSMVYLVAIAVLARGLARREVFIVFPQQISRITKLAVVFNYLTLLLGSQVFIGTWLIRSTMLASLFGVTVLAAWIARKFFSDFWANLGSFLAPPPASVEKRRFDPTRPQGRQAQHD